MITPNAPSPTVCYSAVAKRLHLANLRTSHTSLTSSSLNALLNTKPCLDDMKPAYRQVPTSDPAMYIVCVYSFAKGNVGPRFYECWGHNFDHVSSVCNYNRTPLFCCQVARCFFAVPQEYYVDDYCTPDFKIAGAPDCGAATALSALHDILGLHPRMYIYIYIYEFSPSAGRT